MYNLRGFSRTRTGIEKAQASEVWIKMCNFFFNTFGTELEGTYIQWGGGTPIIRCIFLFSGR